MAGAPKVASTGRRIAVLVCAMAFMTAVWSSPAAAALEDEVAGMGTRSDDAPLWVVTNRGQVKELFPNPGPGLGDVTNRRLNAPIVDLESTPDAGGTTGYWLLGRDGGVFTFGSARFFGSTADRKLNQPVVSMSSPTGADGYWIAAADGGVYSFGVPFYGSMAGNRLNSPIIAIQTTISGKGYWLLARDGGVFAFGDAKFSGSNSGQRLNQTIVSMAPDPDGSGYWTMAADGGIFSFGDAPFFGSAVGKIATGDRASGFSPFRTEAATGHAVVTVQGKLLFVIAGS